MKRYPLEMRSLAAVLCLVAALACTPFFAATAVNAAAGDTYYQEGQVAAKAGQYGAAVQDYQSALLNGHNDPNTFYQLGLAYEQVKQWNNAVWAISMALGDAAFNASTPQAAGEIANAEKAGGENVGPPAALANVSVKALPAPKVNPSEAAVQESQAAYSALQNGAYFVSPGFNQQVTLTTAGGLSAAAEDIANKSNTTTKFVYLDAVPAPYSALSTYAHDLFTHLNLSRAVLVVVTPNAAAAESDRLDAGATARIVARQWGTVGIKDPVNLAATIAQDVVKQADDNDSAAQTKDVAIAFGVIAVVLAVIGLAIFGVMRSGQRERVAARRLGATRSRAH